MMDEVVGHMTEKVVIPPADRSQVTPAPLHHHSSGRVQALRTASEDMVPDMPHSRRRATTSTSPA